MEQNRAGLAVQLVIVALLAVIAFELAVQPHPADTSSSIDNLSGWVQTLDKDVKGLSAQADTANGYLSKESTSTDSLDSYVKSLERDVSQADGLLQAICQRTQSSALVASPC